MTFIVYYHTACTVFWGRAFVPVAILRTAGADFSIKPMPDAPVGAGFAVPMVTFPAGYTISQTPVIAHALGKHFNMIGSGVADEYLCNQLLADNADLLSEVLGGKPGICPIMLYPIIITHSFIPSLKITLSLTYFLTIADRINKWVNYFEGKLGDKEFFLGASYTCVDLSIFATLHLINEKIRVGNPVADGYSVPETLQNFVKKINALPVISQMLAETPILPESRL